MAIIYGTLYMLFSAYPIVYQEGRGWSQGIGGLPFFGVAIGMVLSVAYTIIYDNKRYIRVVERQDGFAPPEARLSPCQVAAVVLPIGLAWFAWTNYPSLPWAASVAAGIPFGFGMVLIFLGILNYLIDAYTIFAASVLAANGVIRSVFGAVFPLFTTQMYHNLGIHWATMVPCFLALACLPFPFLFYKYGAAIRARCKYAAESDVFMKKLRGQLPSDEIVSEEESDSVAEQEALESLLEPEKEKQLEEIRAGDGEPPILNHQTSRSTIGASKLNTQASRSTLGASHLNKQASRSSLGASKLHKQSSRSTLGVSNLNKQASRSSLGTSKLSKQTSQSTLRAQQEYEGNPFDLDRVNTRESFRSGPKHKRSGDLHRVSSKRTEPDSDDKNGDM
jgi:hypothetical protein